MIVIGVDPGASGAFARYDSEANTLEMIDMPTWQQTVGKKKRTRIDVLGIRDYFAVQKAVGVDLVVLEAVGGRPGQSASAAFVFGAGFGNLEATFACCGIAWECTPPAVWKRMMRVPKDDAGIRDAFLKRFPHHAGLIAGGNISRGDRKGERSVKDGRAEAAMLAMYGATYLQGKKPRDDPAARAIYERARKS